MGWTGITLTEFDDVDWFTSPERQEALRLFMGDFIFAEITTDPNDLDCLVIPFGPSFRDSQEFANARHAYRERINGQKTTS